MATAAPCRVQWIVAVVAGKSVLCSWQSVAGMEVCWCRLSPHRSCKNLATSPTRGESEGVRAGVLPKLGLPGLQHSACRMSLLIISLLLLLSAEAVSDKCPKLNFKPYVDQNITIGQQLQISCAIKKSFLDQCSKWNISIIHNNQVLPSQLHRNKTNRQVAVVNVTSAEDRGDYVCMLETRCCEPGDNESMNVQVGYSPKKYIISNEKIVFENQQNLHVSFSVTAPGKDENMIPPNWFATVKSRISCKEVERHNLTRTFFCYQHLYDNRFGNITVIIEGESLGQNLTKELNITPNLIVKPAMVSGVEVEPAARELQVSWDAWVGWPYLQQDEVGGLTHTLTYQSKFDHQPLEAQNVSCDGERCSVQVRGLAPHTLYTLAISCRPNRGGFPSDPYRTEICTLTDVPARGPGLWPWSFTLEQGGKDLAIYPLDIPEGPDRGGDIQDYVVVQYYYNGSGNKPQGAGTTCMRHMRQDMRLLLQTPGTSHRLLLEVPDSSTQDRSLQLGVFATTKAGCSQKASPLQVQLQQESQWRGWVDTVRMDSKNFQVWFEPQEELSVEGRVHWCCPFYNHQSSDPPDCMEELSTEELGVVSGSWNKSIHVNRSCAMSPPKFGVSLTRGQTSSGIIWSSCTYENNRELSRVSLDRMVYNPTEGSLVLSWKLLCANKARPWSYDVAVLAWDQVGLPPSQLCDEAPHYSVNASHRGMELRKRGLTAPRYAVCIRENAQKSGPWHIKELDIPSDISGNQRTVVTVPITVTVAICALVAILVVLCFCYWSRVKKKFSSNNERRAVAFVDTTCDLHKHELFHLFEDDGIPVMPEEFFLKITSEDGSTQAFMDRGCGDGEDSGCRSEEQHSADTYGGSAAVDYGFELQSESGPRTEDVDSGRHSTSNSNSSDHYVEQCTEDT